MMFSKILQIVVAAAFAVGVSAHAKRTPEELAQYHRLVARDAQALNKCLQTREMKDLNARVMAKRQESLHHLRKARGIDLEARNQDDFNKYVSISHDMTGAGKGNDYKNDENLFGYKKGDQVPQASCVLTPEVTFGPFWNERGALRQDIRAGQTGIYQRLALQVIDISNCKPLQGARVDVWQANATGWYAKQAHDQPGESDPHWLTGAQATTDWGLADFDTIFPGHYHGRCVHTHVAVRPSANFNGPDSFIHAGQIFFDDAVREVIETFDPYTQNTDEVVPNIKDGFGPWAATKDYDPIAQWAWLDQNDPEAGLVTWITVGVNTSYHREIN